MGIISGKVQGSDILPRSPKPLQEPHVGFLHWGAVRSQEGSAKPGKRSGGRERQAPRHPGAGSRACGTCLGSPVGASEVTRRCGPARGRGGLAPRLPSWKESRLTSKHRSRAWEVGAALSPGKPPGDSGSTLAPSIDLTHILSSFKLPCIFSKLKVYRCSAVTNAYFVP